MKTNHIFSVILASASLLTACSNDDLLPGNPVMNVTGDLGTACFGDSLPFAIKAEDAQVPLSTIHAELYFGDEMVSEKVIRTKVSGETYEGKLYVPYYADIPDGSATLRLTLQNINFTTTEQTYSVRVTHPDYPSLTFRAETGEEYTILWMDIQLRTNYCYPYLLFHCTIRSSSHTTKTSGIKNRLLHRLLHYLCHFRLVHRIYMHIFHSMLI